MNQTEPRRPTREQPPLEIPPLPVLASSFFLAGLGTVVLGPLLPTLLAEWHLSDAKGGLLLLAKFAGAFAGGATISARLRQGIVAGHVLAAAGFALFALAPGLGVALTALTLAGFGLGQIIASTNVMTGHVWKTHTGSALALLNFFWSLGAVLTGILVAATLPTLGWRRPVGMLATLYACVGVCFWTLTSEVVEPDDSQPARGSRAQPRLWFTFGGELFLYGGLETCLTAWLTTFSLRLAGGHLLGGQSGFVLLWAALTGGRIVASGLLRRFSEVAVQIASLLLCLTLVAALAVTRSPGMLSVVCIALGLAIAPVFPSTFALLLRQEVPTRTAGFLLAVSGLGAALFPWLMGVVSTRAASLRIAMAVPALLIPGMLTLTLLGGPLQNDTRFPRDQRPQGEDPVKHGL